MIKPVINTESYNSLLSCVRAQSVVECRFAQSSEINEIVAVYPQISCVSCEVSSGRVNYSGKLVLTIVYADEEGKLCRMQKGAEFSHFVDGDGFAPAQTGTCALSCDKTTVKRDGSAFVVTVIAGAEIKVYARVERNYLASAEGAFVKTEKSVLGSLVTFSGDSELEDEFDADSVVDVLIPCAKPIVLNCETGTGEIIVTGEVGLSLFAMRAETPVCLERTIPFKCSIACDDASVGKKACCSVEITDLNVTATVNEEHGKCAVSFVCNLAFSGEFCDGAERETVADAFACGNSVKLSYASESVSRVNDVKVYSERVSGLAASKSKLDYTCKFFAVALPKAECEYSFESGTADGVITAVLVYEQNGEIKGTEISLPFAAALNGAASAEQRVCLSASVSGASVRLRAEGEIEMEANVKICACVMDEITCSYVNGVEEGEPLACNDSALSVFIPAAGDGLWEVAKKLSQNPSDVAACNPELNFPLTGKERILIYRSKA